MTILQRTKRISDCFLSENLINEVHINYLKISYKIGSNLLNKLYLILKVN